MSIDRNCLSHDIAVERAKNQLKQLVNSPNTQLVEEYTALVREEFAVIEKFVYDYAARLRLWQNFMMH